MKPILNSYMEANENKNPGCRVSAGAKIARHKLKQIEMMAEAKMMIEKLNQFGKIRSETQIHNSMYDCVIQGQIAEIDSFAFGTSIGIGTGRCFLRKQTGSFN